MTSPLAGSLARTLGRALSSTFLDATLARDTAVAGENDWTPGTPTTKNYSCKAIHVEWRTMLPPGQVLNEKSVRKVIILANSLAVQPRSGDRITIRGETFVVMPEGTSPVVMSDPALATWTCLVVK